MALRIVHLWDADYPWDVRMEKVSTALTAAGHEVHIVARNRRWRPAREELPEGVVHRMPPWTWAGQRADAALGFPAFFNPRWLSLLADTVRTVRADVILARDLPLCPTAIRVGRRFGIPVVLDMAENYPAMMRTIWESGRQRPLDYLVRNPSAVAAVERYCLPRVSRVIVVVEEMADRLRTLGVAPDRIDLVSNTPSRARAERARDVRPKAADAPIDVVHLGILEIPRGLSELIEAMSILRDARPRYRLRLIGTGRDMDVFRRQAAALGLTDAQVEFLGFIESHETALQIIADGDIGAVAQHMSDAAATTITNKLFDYMAAGLPVITSNTPPSARVVRDTGAGEVFRSRDAKDLTAALLRLSSEEVRRARGEAGRRAILDRYNWENDSATLLHAIESAVWGDARALTR